MIRLPDVPLPKNIGKQLRVFQQQLNALPYAERVAEAERRFASRNRPNNAVFREVRRTLAAMCGGTRRCCYCEDSCADEVEHHRPKNHYPDYTFVWANYLYACGLCNGPKRNQFAIFERNTGQRLDLFRVKGASLTPPPDGDPLLIDPRSEDPLAFMELDLRGRTFWFHPTPPISSRDYDRAKYTIEVLRLNTRNALTRARRGAFGYFRSALYQYRVRKEQGESAVGLASLVQEMRDLPHQTVWAEMKRQHHRLSADIVQLFADLPEALTW